jgi:nucleoporin POM152
MAVQRPSLVGKDEDEDEDEDPSSGDTSSSRTLERSQSIRTLKIIWQGKITITDAEKAHVRLGEVTVVECPSASFPAHQPTPPVRCLGEEEKLEIRLKGVPPLSLSYSRLTDSRRERFFVDSIVGSPTVKSLAISITNVLMLVCQDLVNPSYEDVVSLPIKLTSSGTHIFSLESVTDALGNTVSLQSSVTLEVARRASFGFSQCSHGRSIPLLVTGSRSAELRLSSRDMDPRDAPYSVRVMRAEDGETQQVTASSSHETTAFQAKRPGTYEIVSVSGKHCRGIVMSPASCKVVEQPLPRVNVTWSRIHEWCELRFMSGGLLRKRQFWRHRSNGVACSSGQTTVRRFLHDEARRWSGKSREGNLYWFEGRDRSSARRERSISIPVYEDDRRLLPRCPNLVR